MGNKASIAYMNIKKYKYLTQKMATLSKLIYNF